MKVIAHTQVAGPEARGAATIKRLENNQYMLELSDFWVASGAPDVWVALSPELDGQPKASTLDLASYDYNNKAPQFLLDKGIDINEVKTVIVYCKKFNVHFGHGVLEFEG